MTKPFVFTDGRFNTIEIDEDENEVILNILVNEDENIKRIVEIHVSMNTAKCLRDLLNMGLEDED
ncbi:hypothetical protein [Succinatimonas hippei]|uniref:hypothetical protein n=1 Tax=Succinatimonas hippei TaxID=626938 RepID=UPI002491FE09|nr:hypothetical protein [Succinatimonas hippei]